MISHSNLTIYKQWNEEKYLESLQMNVSNSYCKKYKYHLHLELAQLILQPYSLVSSFYIWIFIKKNSYSNVCLKFLCDEKLITPLFIFNIPRKNLKWKQHFYTVTSWNYLLLNTAVWWGCISWMGRRQRWEGALISNLCLISHHWYEVKRLTAPGSSNANFTGSQQNLLC